MDDNGSSRSKHDLHAEQQTLLHQLEDLRARVQICFYLEHLGVMVRDRIRARVRILTRALPHDRTETEQHHDSNIDLATVHHASHSPGSRANNFPFCSKINLKSAQRVPVCWDWDGRSRLEKGDWIVLLGAAV
jgi:hypothetical protein